LDHLLFQLSNSMLKVAILLFDSLDITSRSGAASDSIGREALGIILQARRTASRKSIAPDLADLPRELALHALPWNFPWTQINYQLTLQRSQACPVRDELASRFLTALENSSGCSALICFAPAASGSPLAGRF
jgi:hypothetical protein